MLKTKRIYKKFFSILNDILPMEEVLSKYTVSFTSMYNSLFLCLSLTHTHTHTHTLKHTHTHIYIYIYIRAHTQTRTHTDTHTHTHTHTHIYIYIYVYLGSISSLMQISLNIIDILCLHIFFWIRSNSRITFIVFWGNWFIYCPYGQYKNQFPQNTIKVILEFERIQKKICRHKMSIMFNEICILPFPKKGDLGLAKNYRGITLTSIAAKIYNALLRNRIEPKIDNILRKNQNGFRRNRSTTSQILTIRRILEGVRAKNLQATLIFVDFTKAFDSIHRGKMEQILLAYGIPKETVAAITILYRNTKVKVRSPDGDTEYFDIVAGVLQGDTLAPYLFIICLDYVLRTSIDKIKENGFELTKKRSRRYPATTITDADYADDIAILANTPDQAETLLHSLERAAASIGLHVNAHKTEYMCYNQTGDISTLEGTPLKLVDKFTYLGSSVESTEKDIETRLTKAWTAINRLSTIWKSDLTDKMKRSFFQAAVTSILLYGCTTWTLTKRLEKKLDGNYTRMLRAILNKSWQQHPTRHQLYGHLPPITKSIQVRRTRHAGHCWRSRDELIRDVLLWIPTHGRAKAGRPARTYIQQLCEDTGCCPEDLPRAMNDREEWRERVRDIRAASTIWWWWWYIYMTVASK